MENKNEKSNHEFISILNRVKHKPLIIQDIFPFLDNRPYIFPCLFEKDINLNKELNKLYKSMKKNSELSSQINPNIYKFLAYKLLYQTPLIDIEEENTMELFDLNFLFDYEDNNINDNCLKNKFNFCYSFDSYISLVKKSFEKKVIPDNINIKKNILYNYLPKDKAMINFVKDYLSQNDILHIPYPQDGNYHFLIEKLIKYLNKKNNSDNIKGIIFDDLYNIENLETFGCLGNKIKDFNFSSLEFIKIRKYTNNLRNIKLYYELNKLFSANSLLGLTIINKDDIKNLFNLDEEEKKLKNKFSKKNEILYIDLEGYSPYTENFIFYVKII